MTKTDPPSPTRPRRVCLVGATGTIGRATLHALVREGFEVVCLVRRRDAGVDTAVASVRVVDFSDRDSVVRDGFGKAGVDAVVSCMASRSGVPADAWAVDHRAQVDVLAAARDAGVGQFVLLSAMCVQKPALAFQRAKLAAEAALIEMGTGSGLVYSIVRPTAFFKSLSGQVERVRRGRPFLLFGDGRGTACKPISDGDLADYLVGCLTDRARWNRVLPIGGPGPAITPRDQGEALFALLGREARFRSVPVRLLDAVAGVLEAAGRVAPGLAAKAELARIGRYYATESMLVWDAAAGRYDAGATPETGTETLFAYYRRLLAGADAVERGAHSVF